MRTHFVGVGAAGCLILDAFSDRSSNWRCHASAVGVGLPSTPTPTVVDRLTVTRRELTDFTSGLDGDDLLDDASYFDRLRARDGTSVADAVAPPSSPEGVVVVVDFTTRVGASLAGPLLASLRTTDAPVYLVAVSDRTLSHVSVATRQTADATIGVDVDAWTAPDAESPADDPQFCTAIATRLQATFCHVSPSRHPQRVIDAGDIHRILGTSGSLVSVGYAEEQLATESPTPLGLTVFDSNTDHDVSELSHAIRTVTRKALHGTQTLPTQTQAADRCLFVIGGPPQWLLHTQVTASRDEVLTTVEPDLLLSGDVPVANGDHLFAAVVRAGVLPRRTER